MLPPFYMKRLSSASPPALFGLFELTTSRGIHTIAPEKAPAQKDCAGEVPQGREVIVRRSISKLLFALAILTGSVLGGGLVVPSHAAADTGCPIRCLDRLCGCVFPSHRVGGVCVYSDRCVPNPDL